MHPFSLVLSSALDDEEAEAPTVSVLRYCHHCQRPIEGHQFQFAPNRWLCKKCWPLRYVLLSYEERVRPGPGDRISSERMEFS